MKKIDIASVSDAELEQKTSEYIQWVKDYAANKKKDFTIKSKREGFKVSCFDKDVTLEFSL